MSDQEKYGTEEEMEPTGQEQVEDLDVTEIDDEDLEDAAGGQAFDNNNNCNC